MNTIKSKIDLDHIIDKYGINYKNQQGEGFLHEFARNGEMSLIIHLFDTKRIERYNINIKNNLGRTALFDALNEEIVEFLLYHKIDYKSKDNEGKTAEEVNRCVNFVVNQRCNENKKKLLKNLGLGN